MAAQRNVGTGGPWRNPDFVHLVLTGGVSAVGTRTTREGLPLLSVLPPHATAGDIGVLAAIRAAAALLVGPLCGRWVDRTRRRRLCRRANGRPTPRTHV
jgi:hypothetical protein